jgi:hypothetical protein
MLFRLDLWLFWFSDYKEMSSLARQELVEKLSWWRGNRGSQITSIFLFFFDGKDVFLITFLALPVLSLPSQVQPRSCHLQGALDSSATSPPEMETSRDYVLLALTPNSQQRVPNK